MCSISWHSSFARWHCEQERRGWSNGQKPGGHVAVRAQEQTVDPFAYRWWRGVSIPSCLVFWRHLIPRLQYVGRIVFEADISLRRIRRVEFRGNSLEEYYRASSLRFSNVRLTPPSTRSFLYSMRLLTKTRFAWKFSRFFRLLIHSLWKTLLKSSWFVASRCYQIHVFGKFKNKNI